MLKRYKKKKNKNKNKNKNKGFTLVELIVVIAILAILVGLLAPQYTKYVEKSRKAADLNNLDNIVNAIKVAASDSEYHLGSRTKETSEYIIVIGTIYKGEETVDGMALNKTSCDKEYDQVLEALVEYAGVDFTPRETNSDLSSWFDNDNIKIKSGKWGVASFAHYGYMGTTSGIAAFVRINNTTGAITVTYSDNVVKYLDHGTID